MSCVAVHDVMELKSGKSAETAEITDFAGLIVFVFFMIHHHWAFWGYYSNTKRGFSYFLKNYNYF
jgi:hypothetical protein